MSITSPKTPLLLLMSFWGAADRRRRLCSDAGGETPCAQQHCSTGRNQGTRALWLTHPPQRLFITTATSQNKGGSQTALVPLMTEDEGCPPRAHFGGFVCLGLVLCHWISFTTLISSSPACHAQSRERPYLGIK